MSDSTVSVTTKPRYPGWVIALVAVIAVAAVVVAIWVLCVRSGVFGPTTQTVSTADGTTTVTSTELAISGFAVVALIGFGALILTIGVALGLAELSNTTTTAPQQSEPAEGEEGALVDASGIAAVLAAVGELAKGLGTAVKGMRASGMAMLFGALVMIFGGTVAWQTVPGTDRSPTITISPAATATSPAAETSTGTATATSLPPTSTATTPATAETTVTVDAQPTTAATGSG